MFPTPEYLEQFWQNSFDLKKHLQQFLKIDLETLETNLARGEEQLKLLGQKDFNWEEATNFYREKVNEKYLFELGAWHLNSSDYIGDTLRLIADNAKGLVLDFGGGIGTHTIGAAFCPKVEKVFYCDINPVNENFVRHRVEELGLTKKVDFLTKIELDQSFDTIMTFDVMEHLPNPEKQLLDFHHLLTEEGKLIINWYFFKGFQQQFPFHLDDEIIINKFFKTLQFNFLEVFQPYFITTRCYGKMPKYIHN